MVVQSVCETSAAGVDWVPLEPVMLEVKLLFSEMKLAPKLRLGCASRVSESVRTSAVVSLLC